MKKIAIFAAVMVIGAGVALASTLNVPFFLDNRTSVNLNDGIVGRIGIKSGSNSPQTITVVYTALNASDQPVDQTVTFALGANQQVRWTPVQVNTDLNPGDSRVPNMTIPRIAGSAKIVGTAISGTYSEIDMNRGAVSMHVLREL